MDDRTRDALPLIAWIASLVVALVAFTAMGGGALAGPPVTDPGSWGQWAAGRDPVVATFAVLRLVVLALAWYLVGVTTVGAVARVARWTRLVRVADALSVPMVRRVLQASLGVGLATSVVVSSAPIATPPPRGPTVASAAAQTALDAPAMRPVDTGGPTADAPVMTPVEVEVEVDADLPAPPGMRPLPVEPAAPTTDHDDTAPAPTDPLDHRPTVTAEVGDHLWSIAARRLAEVRGPDVDDDAVTTYWRAVVDANRDRLVDPDNPDLILPGQQFVLPSLDTGTDA